MPTVTRFFGSFAGLCTTLAAVGLGLALACAQRQGPPPAPAAGQQPAPSGPARSSVAGTGQTPAPVVAVPLEPCERVRQHNLAMLREASARVATIVAGLGGASLPSRIGAAEQAAKTAGAVTTRAGVRLDSLDDQPLTTLALLDYDARAYANASERVATLNELNRALSDKQPIPITTQASFDVELCKPDAQGAWAFWTDGCRYRAFASTRSRFRRLMKKPASRTE